MNFTLDTCKYPLIAIDDNSFLKIVYVINVLAHRCVERVGGRELISLFNHSHKCGLTEPNQNYP